MIFTVQSRNDSKMILRVFSLCACPKVGGGEVIAELTSSFKLGTLAIWSGLAIANSTCGEGNIWT